MNGGKIIAAGHVCLDITPVFPGGKSVSKLEELLIPGKLLHVESANVSAGGSVSNTGLALKILGNDVALMGKIGDDAFGAMVQQIFARYGADGLLVNELDSTSYSVVLAMPGIDRIFLHNPGANDTFSNEDIPESSLEEAVLFHFGYPPLMKRIYENGGQELSALLRRMKRKGIATSLDFAAIDPASQAGKVDWAALLSRVLPDVDFFLPSFEELCFMLAPSRYEQLGAMGADMIAHLDIDRDVKPLAQQLLELGCRCVLIKCGTAGMYLCTGSMEGVGCRLKLDTAQWSNVSHFQPCFKAEIVRSATGAGDTSIAAFLTAMLRGKAPQRCAALAAAEGACAVTSYDALSGLKPLEALETAIDAGWQTKGETSKCL